MGLSTEKQVLASHLKLLQAQIEPHFLFNTLSNILSLMDADLDKAKSMQLNLIQYLRTSLRRSRAKDTTLFQEMDLIRAYLVSVKSAWETDFDIQSTYPRTLARWPFRPCLFSPWWKTPSCTDWNKKWTVVKLLSGPAKMMTTLE